MTTPDELTLAVRVLSRVGRLLERSCGEVTLAQYRVLRMVADGGNRASRLADLLALARPTITDVVNGLVTRGLLTREALAEDRRGTTLRLTGAGEAALGAAESSMAERLAGVVGELDDADRLLVTLDDLDRALDVVFGMVAGARREGSRQPAGTDPGLRTP